LRTPIKRRANRNTGITQKAEHPNFSDALKKGGAVRNITGSLRQREIEAGVRAAPAAFGSNPPDRAPPFLFCFSARSSHSSRFDSPAAIWWCLKVRLLTRVNTSSRAAAFPGQDEILIGSRTFVRMADGSTFTEKRTGKPIVELPLADLLAINDFLLDRKKA